MHSIFTYIRCQGGLTMPKLIHHRPDLYDFLCLPLVPDIVYLKLGGNDLSIPPVNEVLNNIIQLLTLRFIC